MSGAVLEANQIRKVLGHGAGQVHALRGVDLALS
jgi:predicted ABC-type transport system involved in lysophospholipase L1 biosynthesis ATPase subunit